MLSLNSRGILKKWHRVSEEAGFGLASAASVGRGPSIDLGIVLAQRDQDLVLTIVIGGQ